MGWGNNNSRIISIFNDVSAVIIIDLQQKAVLSAFLLSSHSLILQLKVSTEKHELTFTLGPQVRPVLPAGRLLGECGNVVILRDEGCSAPLRSARPPAPSVGRRYPRLYASLLRASETQMEKNADANLAGTPASMNVEPCRC